MKRKIVRFVGLSPARLRHPPLNEILLFGATTSTTMRTFGPPPHVDVPPDDEDEGDMRGAKHSMFVSPTSTEDVPLALARRPPPPPLSDDDDDVSVERGDATEPPHKKHKGHKTSADVDWTSATSTVTSSATKATGDARRPRLTIDSLFGTPVSIKQEPGVVTHASGGGPTSMSPLPHLDNSPRQATSSSTRRSSLVARFLQSATEEDDGGASPPQSPSPTHEEEQTMTKASDAPQPRQTAAVHLHPEPPLDQTTAAATGPLQTSAKDDDGRAINQRTASPTTLSVQAASPAATSCPALTRTLPASTAAVSPPTSLMLAAATTTDKRPPTDTSRPPDAGIDTSVSKSLPKAGAASAAPQLNSDGEVTPPSFDEESGTVEPPAGDVVPLALSSTPIMLTNEVACDDRPSRQTLSSMRDDTQPRDEIAVPAESMQQPEMDSIDAVAPTWTQSTAASEPLASDCPEELPATATETLDAKGKPVAPSLTADIDAFEQNEKDESDTSHHPPSRSMVTLDTNRVDDDRASEAPRPLLENMSVDGASPLALLADPHDEPLSQPPSPTNNERARKRPCRVPSPCHTTDPRMPPLADRVKIEPVFEPLPAFTHETLMEHQATLGKGPGRRPKRVKPPPPEVVDLLLAENEVEDVIDETNKDEVLATVGSVAAEAPHPMPPLLPVAMPPPAVFPPLFPRDGNESEAYVSDHALSDAPDVDHATSSSPFYVPESEPISFLPMYDDDAVPPPTTGEVDGDASLLPPPPLQLETHETTTSESLGGPAPRKEAPYASTMFPRKEALIEAAFDSEYGGDDDDNESGVAMMDNHASSVEEASDEDEDEGAPPPPPPPSMPPSRLMEVVDLSLTPPPDSPLRLQAKQLPPHIYYNGTNDGLLDGLSSSSSSSSSGNTSDASPPPSDASSSSSESSSESEASDKDDAVDRRRAAATLRRPQEEPAASIPSSSSPRPELPLANTYAGNDSDSDVEIVGVVPAPAAVLDAAYNPILRGTYQVAHHEATWSGRWGFTHLTPQTQTTFSYKCVNGGGKWALGAPQTGLYNGFFYVQNRPGAKLQRILEKRVHLEFTELAPNMYLVEGRGKNKFGAFALRGYLEWGTPLMLEKIYDVR
ncbi:Aste57867_15781 [Aphanomyces stellatus]|uniref:Aste57867_15781 protein n=1 Tax=Aphanomyces stellatus TaxID=120398 RepID=A0A485L4W4_9STRA|nr:hypothetical protein As57867_015725 [Aphanomyces stellatus]VFT92569.1 Aste57867_15781 [Aphanomyces stellatus]